MAEFKHFSPIGNVTIPKVIPNFTGIDFANPKKNLPQLEELAVSAGLGLLKGQILKNTLQFFQPHNPVVKNKIAFANNGSNTMPVLGYNALNFPVYSNLIIAGDNNTDNNGKVIRQWNDIRLDAVIMEISMAKNLVKTDIQGRDNTVIEVVSQRSHTVHVYGRILADTPGVYPQSSVVELLTALQSNKALRVTSWFLAMAGIYNIVVDPASIRQEEGGQEYQKFEFDGIADRPVILKIKK